MNRMEREATVRQMMERSVPHVPAEMHAQVVLRGGRILRRRTIALRLWWLLVFAATVAFVVWAVTARPWVEPPSETTPPLTGW
ncbi:hypothetical protein [Streptomyces sp. NPDC002588]|uniref:hypothetical protein n=1 Tax=Streptomyces sp. NPDC002588 TaxID=3154419 RepID=UPI0033219895